MRLLASTIIALFVSFAIFIMVKMWGQSQPFIDYQHPFLAQVQSPIVFHSPKTGWTIEQLAQSPNKNIFLNFAVTQDSIAVILREEILQVHGIPFAEIQNKVYTAEQIKSVLQDKKIIFNIVENPIAGPDIFIEFINNVGLQESRNFLVQSPFEVPLKYIKEKQPTYLFGTTQPEILRIKALENMWLIEAATFRADIVVHPPYFYKHEFFTPTLLAELQRRFKRYIVGPVVADDLEKTKDLGLSKNAFAIIVTD